GATLRLGAGFEAIANPFLHRGRMIAMCLDLRCHFRSPVLLCLEVGVGVGPGIAGPAIVGAIIFDDVPARGRARIAGIAWPMHAASRLTAERMSGPPGPAAAITNVERHFIAEGHRLKRAAAVQRVAAII